MRWRLEEDGGGGQDALFEEEVERHAGRGEFRGMEFLHVRARRIINEVPAASRVPFRYTINAYRGCSHACVYCAAGETAILMGDGRSKPLADVRAGDIVYGTVRLGHHRHYVRTPVLDHWCTVKPAYRVVLADGTELIASGEHRFLTDRGWKHVTGSDQGHDRRPHITTLDKLIGTGRFAAAPQESREYRAGYLCGVVRGDGHTAVRHHRRPDGQPWTSDQFRVALADAEALHRTRAYLGKIGVKTGMFLFRAGAAQRRELLAIRNQTAAGVATVGGEIAWRDRPSDDWCKGFLAGLFDAEGCASGVIGINRDEQVIRRTTTCLDRFGFRTVAERTHHRNGLSYVRLRGGLPERLRFFHTLDPAISRKRSIAGEALESDASLGVVDIEPLDRAMPLYDITTGTGDFIANGVVSHNCFARPTHEFLDMGVGEDFERRIVVKVNAVERLRAELAPSRWSGEHIAMGTNTDPYQRCEGKYHLTRGIVAELSRARNPFSILTKSTLILRDLDLLAEAARRADVRANFSVGTLDEDVWRSSEPGTPHPRRRLEAVARLNRAGIPCGVLVAPVLPGLSDRPEQLDAVVAASVSAGAVSISAIPLHLRQGVRDHYMGWLGATRPDLVDRYESAYRRAYLPRKEQDDVTQLVAELVARHRGRSVVATRSRDVRRAAGNGSGSGRSRSLSPPPLRQLDLGI